MADENKTDRISSNERQSTYYLIQLGGGEHIKGRGYFRGGSFSQNLTLINIIQALIFHCKF